MTSLLITQPHPHQQQQLDVHSPGMQTHPCQHIPVKPYLWYCDSCMPTLILTHYDPDTLTFNPWSQKDCNSSVPSSVTVD